MQVRIVNTYACIKATPSSKPIKITNKHKGIKCKIK